LIARHDRDGMDPQWCYLGRRPRKDVEAPRVGTVGSLLCEGALFAYTQITLSGDSSHYSLHRAALVLSVGGGVVLMSIIISTLPPIDPEGRR
jgi:hypothetical protein